MFKKLKNIIVLTITGVIIAVPGAVPGVIAVAAAAESPITSGLCTGTEAATGANCNTGTGNVSTNIQNIGKNVVNIISIIVGILAVIFIIYGGFKYITSGGDSGKVSEAKNALIYAIVGLLIVAIAQAIVHFVLTAGNNVNTGSTGTL